MSTGENAGEQRRVRVLSIDGGGVLGVIPAEILAGLEHLAGKPIAELFDLIVGTSVGALLALMLTRPDGPSAPEVADLFPRHDKRMFVRRPMRRVKCIDLACGSRYRADALESVLAEHLGDAPLHAAKTRVTVNAFDMLASRLVPLRSDATGPLDASVVRMRDAARAATAAPTYFPPHVVRSGLGGGESACLIDAGVCVNNPTQVALAEAVRAFRVPPARVTILSLGCGVRRESFDAEAVEKWSRVRWVCPLLRMLTDGTVVDDQMRTLADATPGLSYTRLDPPLTGPGLPASFDDCRAPRLRAARDLGRAAFEEAKPRFVELLT
jgi:patatin-like phospholipase/acyl hydrolase